MVMLAFGGTDQKKYMSGNLRNSDKHSFKTNSKQGEILDKIFESEWDNPHDDVTLIGIRY
jgi:hypothetical protein